MELFQEGQDPPEMMDFGDFCSLRRSPNRDFDDSWPLRSGQTWDFDDF